MEDDYNFEDFDYEPEQIEKVEDNPEPVLANKNNLNTNQIPTVGNNINNNINKRIEMPIDDFIDIRNVSTKNKISNTSNNTNNINQNYASNYSSNSNKQTPKITEKKITQEDDYGYEDFDNPEEVIDDIQEIKEIDDIDEVVSAQNKNNISDKNNYNVKDFSSEKKVNIHSSNNNVYKPNIPAQKISNNSNNYSSNTNHKITSGKNLEIFSSGLEVNNNNNTNINNTSNILTKPLSNPKNKILNAPLNDDNSISSIYPTRGNDQSVINNNYNYNKASSNIVPLSKMQIAEKNYFELKEQLESLVKDQNLNQDNKSKTVDHISKQNLEMIKYLDKMNGIINTIIESSKVPTKNPNFSRKTPYQRPLNNNNPNLTTNNKLLEVFRKENLKLEERLKQISDPKFDESLDDTLSELNSQINFYEAEVKKLKYQQKQSEILVERQCKNNNSSLPSNAEFQKINQEYENIKRLNEMTLEKVHKNKSQISDNETRLKELNEWLGKLETIAKDMYGIKTFENFKEEEKSEKKKEEKKIMLKKKLDTLEKVQSTNKRRYENEITRNEKSIVNLEKNKIELMKLLKEKSIVSYKTQEKVKGIYSKYEDNSNMILSPTDVYGSVEGNLIVNKIINGINYGSADVGASNMNNVTNPADNSAINDLNNLKDVNVTTAVEEVNGRGNNPTVNNSNLNDTTNPKNIINQVNESYIRKGDVTATKKDIIMQLENKKNLDKDKEIISSKDNKEPHISSNNLNAVNSSTVSNPQINSRHFKPNIKFGNNVVTNPNSNLGANQIKESAIDNINANNESYIQKRNLINRNDEIAEDIPTTGVNNNEEIKEVVDNNFNSNINSNLNTNLRIKTNINRDNLNINTNQVTSLNSNSNNPISRVVTNNINKITSPVNNIIKNEINLDEETPLNISRRRNNRENKENLNTSVVGNPNLNRSNIASNNQINNTSQILSKNDTSILKEKSNVPLFLQDFHKKNEDNPNANTSLLNISENKIIPASRRISQATTLNANNHNSNSNTNQTNLFTNNGGSSTFNERKPVSIFDDPFKDEQFNKKPNNDTKFILEESIDNQPQINTYDRKKKEEFDKLFKDDEEIKDIRPPRGNLLFSNKNNNVSTTGRNRDNIGNGNNHNGNIFSLNEGIENNKKIENNSNKTVKPRNILDELEEIVL
jgi:hypothetical protein